MEKLVQLVHQHSKESWKIGARDAFSDIFGNRYKKNAENTISLRAPDMRSDDGVPFAALIHKSNPESGAYGGMSFVIFPSKDETLPCLISMCVGTNGLNPDENILSRPGHARKIAAICKWLNSEFGKGQMIAWAKQDPVRTDMQIPSNIKEIFSEYQSMLERYGKELYGIFRPNSNTAITELAIKAFLDFMFSERGFEPLAAHKDDYESIRSKYYAYMMPNASEGDIINLLGNQKFVIIEGPPGTGKTYTAENILKTRYKGNGTIIQFHPNVTYENFVGGLAPITTSERLGLAFKPQRGHLMEAAKSALQIYPEPYLLVIDEINRADLSKVLGEAIYLFEYQSEDREVVLPYDFGGDFANKLKLPANLHVLGTMNSADRSIAILDVAIRRRFAFIKLWPRMDVVAERGGNKMNLIFKETIRVFIDYAEDNTFALVPGHTYFLEPDDKKACDLLSNNLIPLLEEYLAQGYVANFSDALRGHIQWVNSVISDEKRS